MCAPVTPGRSPVVEVDSGSTAGRTSALALCSVPIGGPGESLMKIITWIEIILCYLLEVLILGPLDRLTRKWGRR